MKGMTTMEWLAIAVIAIVIFGTFYYFATLPRTQVATMAASSLIVVTNCGDKVICYQMGSTWGGMQCFRDADLVARYCKTGNETGNGAK